VPYKESPKYNPRRRAPATALSRANSDASASHHGALLRSAPLHGQRRGLAAATTAGLHLRRKPPSPSPSDRSLPPFSSGSSVSEASTGSGGSTTIGSGSIILAATAAEEHLDSASAFAADFANGKHDISKETVVSVSAVAEGSNGVDVLSLSSGVGTSSTQSGSAGHNSERQAYRGPLAAASVAIGAAMGAPSSPAASADDGNYVVCREDFSSADPSALCIVRGDIIEGEDKEKYGKRTIGVCARAFLGPPRRSPCWS